MGVQDRGSASDVQNQALGALDSMMASTQDYTGRVASKAQAVVDGVLPPESRSALLEKAQAFMYANPKLSTFLGINLLFTGIPLCLFLLFSISITLCSLVVGLLLGLLGAVLFILVAVGTALCIALPAIFFTTTCACLLFMWGLAGYYALQWVNGITSEEAPKDGANGDKLNALTGGRLAGLVDQMNQERSRGEIEPYNGPNPPERSMSKEIGTVNGIAKKASKKMDDVAQNAPKANGADGILKTELNTTSTANRW